jgi:Tfp pilus assembly protein PilF
VENIEVINQGYRLINRSHLDNIRRYFFINSIVWWNDIEGMQKNKTLINSMLDSAFALEPKAAYLLTTKALVFKMEGKIDSAVVYLQQAGRSSPTWLMPKYLLGVAMEEQGKVNEALHYYEEIMLLDTSYQTFECAICFYLNMGEIYVQQKQFNAAKQVFLKGYKMDSLSFEIMEGLLDVANKTKDENQINFWLNKIKQATKSTTDKLNLLQLMMENKLITGKEALLQLDSIEAYVHSKEEQFLHAYTSGLTKEISGKYPIDDYEEAYGLNPYDFNCISKLLRLYIEKGVFKMADQLVDEALPKFTGWRWQMIRYYQALSYAYNKKEEQALSIFKELIQQNLVDCKEIIKIKALKNAASYKDFLQACK